MTLGKFALRLIVSTILVFGLMILVDPQYLDRPLAEGEAGLPANEAPGGIFATMVGVEIPDENQLITIFLKTRDVTLQVSGEFLDPQGNLIVSEKFLLASGTASQKSSWANWLVPPRGTGRHAVRISQDKPGRIALYFFQGPFWERILGLPIVMTLLNLIVFVVRRSAKVVEK